MAKINRPHVLGGLVVRETTGCGNMYVQLCWYHGKLFEIFATLGHSGGCAMSNIEATTRVITAGLRQETPVPVEEYIDQLHEIRCHTPHMFPPEERTLSCADAIAKALKEYGSLTVEQVVKIFMDSDGDTKPSTKEDDIAILELEKLAKIRREQDI